MYLVKIGIPSPAPFEKGSELRVMGIGIDGSTVPKSCILCGHMYCEESASPIIEHHLFGKCSLQERAQREERDRTATEHG